MHLVQLHNLARFSAKIISDTDFQEHIDRMETHFQNYAEMWLTGHFSNAFVKKTKGLPKKYPGCDFRILAINPKGTKANLNALRELRNEGAKVKKSMIPCMPECSLGVLKKPILGI